MNSSGTTDSVAYWSRTGCQNVLSFEVASYDISYILWQSLRIWQYDPFDVELWSEMGWVQQRVYADLLPAGVTFDHAEQPNHREGVGLHLFAWYKGWFKFLCPSKNHITIKCE